MKDNFPGLATEALQLRGKSVLTGKLVGGLFRSTESRKTKLGSLLSPLSALLSPI